MTNNQQLAAITAEERAALVEYLGLTEEQRKDKYDAMSRYELRIMAEQIALASLEANPTYLRLFGHYGYGDSCWLECGSSEEGAKRFYTAPPVAVMQPVKLPQGYSVRMGHDVCRPGGDGRPVLIPEDRGNWLDRHAVELAIRAAGGSVKE